MAIKRLDPKARFRVVSQFDDAVDRSDSEADTRYAKYLESLDLADLKFKEGATPTFFNIRTLSNLELADFNSRYLSVDPEKKHVTYKGQAKMFLEMFDACCESAQDGADGPAEKITSAEVPLTIAHEIGSIISLIGTLSKNLKKA